MWQGSFLSVRAVTRFCPLANVCLDGLGSAQYNNRAYAITSATTWSTNPATNYNSGAFSITRLPCLTYSFVFLAVLYRGLVYVWGNGSGPTMVAYQQYDFSGVAPDANRFCASGQPRFYVNYHDVCYAPTAYSQWQVDAPTSSWYVLLLRCLAFYLLTIFFAGRQVGSPGIISRRSALPLPRRP